MTSLRRILIQIYFCLCVTSYDAQFRTNHRPILRYYERGNWNHTGHRPTPKFIWRNSGHRQQKQPRTMHHMEIVKETKYKYKSPVRETNDMKVKIVMYYEVLCPGSIQYLTSRLRRTVENLGQHLDIHLVPYGHGQTIFLQNNRYQFKCQHGALECFGNRVHACVIDIMKNSTTSTIYNACLMDRLEYKTGDGFDYYKTAINWCNQDLKVDDGNKIWLCANTRQGFLLQKDFGIETHKYSPEYVPYVLIDGVEDVQAEDLTTMICRKLDLAPYECPRSYTRRTRFRGWISQ